MRIKKRDIIAMGFGLLFLTGFSIYLFFFEDPLGRHYECSDLKVFENTTIDCMVKEKYIDRKNHSFRTIDFVNCENMVIVKDTSSFFGFIAEGDSITKPLNTDTIYVYRADEIHRFKIYFGCDD